MNIRILFRTLVVGGFLGLLVCGTAEGLNLGIAVNSGDQVTSAIDPAGDEDPVIFDAAAGSLLTASAKQTKGSALAPGLRLIDPNGAEIDVAAFTKKSTKSVSLKKVTLPLTGRYALHVTGEGGSTGGYQFKWKLKPPKGAKMKGETVAAGATVDHLVGGVEDAQLTVSIKIKGGDLSLVDILDPDGAPVVGWKTSLKVKAGKSIKGKVFLSGPFGDYTVRLGDVTADATYDIATKVKFPKTAKQKLEVAANEPTIDDVYATLSGVPFGAVGENVTLEGTGFSTFPHDPEVYFGDNPVTSFVTKREDLLVVKAPAGEGLVDIVVVNPDGNVSRAEDAFTYVGNAPSDLALSDNRAGVDGGMVLTITGSNLDFVRKVSIGTVFVALVEGETLTPAEEAQFPIAVVNDSLRTVTGGGGEVTSLTLTTATLDPIRAGVHDLEVWDIFGQRSSPMTFELVGPPDVDAVNPAGGTYLGGTEVMLHGGNAADWQDVYLAGTKIDTTYVAPDVHKLTTPPHAKGIVEVRVVDIFGQETVLPEGYEFNAGGWLNVTEGNFPAEDVNNLKRGDTLAVGDVNGDDDADIVISRDTPSGVEKLLKLFTGDGTGKFTDASATSIPLPPEDVQDIDENSFKWNASSVALGDLDGDGDLDLVTSSQRIFFKPVANYGTNPLVRATNRPYSSTRLFLNNGSGKFTDATDDKLPSVRATGADLFQGNTLALGDVDGDDDVDIVLSLYRQPALVELTVNYTGNQWYPSRYAFEFKYPPFSSVELASATRLLLNDGKAKFTNASKSKLPDPDDGDILVAHDVTLADIDQDGDPDLVITVENDDTRTQGKKEYINDAETGSRSKTRILTNSGGSFTNDTQFLMPKHKTWDDWGGIAVAAGDLDGDDAVDLVVSTNRALYNRIPSTVYYPRTRIFLQKDGEFEEAPDLMPGVRADGQGEMYEGRAIALEDIDGDGSLDVVLVTPTQMKGEDPDTGKFDQTISSTRILRNDGSGALTDVTSRKLPNADYGGDAFRAHDVWLGDLDGNSSLDLVLTTSLPVARPTRILLFE